MTFQLPTPGNFKSFSENDWHGLAGAERFDGDVEPFIFIGALEDGAGFQMSIDRNGAFLLVEDDLQSNDYGGWNFEKPHGDRADAEKWINELLAGKKLISLRSFQAIGFEAV